MRDRLCLALVLSLVLFRPCVYAQSDTGPTFSDKWQLFKEETVAPVLVIGSAVTTAVSHVTHSDPRYGLGTKAFAERLGASTADNISQNFFSDCLVATALHQDTRYRRRGPAHRFWARMGYAVSRAFVTRKNTGGNTFNWSNFVGTGMSAGLSNAYYPSLSRTSGAILINWSTAVIGAGFGNLFPEFMPDMRNWLKRHHL